MSTAFLSYSWDSEVHRAWVRELAARLHADGVKVDLDQWKAIPGDNLPVFMETAIRDNEYVIIVCTPRYKEKSDKRQGGVGYEGDIMTAEAFVGRNPRKFVPVLRLGEWPNAAPSWLLGKFFVDLRGRSWRQKYPLLRDTLHKRLPEPPPVQAQGFLALPDGSVLDTMGKLVWTNCRDETLVELQICLKLLEQAKQVSGWDWRLPTDDEVVAVQEAEKFYPYPPILVTARHSHPFKDNFEKQPWTPTRMANVRRSMRSGDGFNANAFAAPFAGAASILGVNPYHMAAETTRLGRLFIARFVRPATQDDVPVTTR